jgi:hypothetical protein
MEIYINNSRKRVMTFLLTAVAMSISTKLIHMIRSIALSAPRKWRTALFKYLFVPYVFSTYTYT